MAAPRCSAGSQARFRLVYKIWGGLLWRPLPVGGDMFLRRACGRRAPRLQACRALCGPAGICAQIRSARALSLYYSRPPARGMEYVYAALLLHKLDKDVTEQSVSSVVQASGAEVNQAQVKSLVAALADVDIDEAVKAAPVAVAAAAAPAAAAPAAEESGDAAEEKKEKDDSQSEEQAMAGLTSLFG